jgi:lysophospholipase L1-like esterase
MAQLSRAILKGQFLRLARLTIVLAPLVLLGIVGTLWIKSATPEWVFWKIGLVFLTIVEGVFVSAAFLSLVGVLVCGVIVFKRSRERRSVRGVGRWLLLSLSTLAALAVAEAGSSVWQQRYHSRTALPVGGVRGAQSAKAVFHLAELPTVDQLPSAFRDARDGTQIDILVLGESSAEGVPLSQWVSIGSMIRWKLSEVFPERPVSVEVRAMSRQTLEKQQEALEWVQRRPEILIIYCGHNEFSSRLAAERDIAYYFDDAVPTVWDFLVDRVEALSPFCGMVRENIEKCRIAIPPPLEGNRDLIDTPAYTSTEYATLLVDFRRRLDLLVSYAEKLGALPVLIIPAANDGGFDPDRSFLPAATPGREREAFRRDFLAAKQLEHSEPAAALAAYRALLARQPGFAETHYRLAQLLEREQAWEEAYEHYAEARNLDGYPLRMLTPFQDAYRDIATQHRCILIDTQTYFHAIGRHGLLDDFLFQDGLHPSLRGQIALAQRVLQALRDREAFGWPDDKPAPVIDPSECVKRFGLGRAEWQWISNWTVMFYDLTNVMRYDPRQRLQKRQVYVSAAARLARGEAPDALGLPNLGVPEAVPILPIVGAHE